MIFDACHGPHLTSISRLANQGEAPLHGLFPPPFSTQHRNFLSHLAFFHTPHVEPQRPSYAESSAMASLPRQDSRLS